MHISCAFVSLRACVHYSIVGPPPPPPPLPPTRGGCRPPRPPMILCCIYARTHTLRVPVGFIASDTQPSCLITRDRRPGITLRNTTRDILRPRARTRSKITERELKECVCERERVRVLKLHLRARTEQYLYRSVVVSSPTSSLPR